MNPIFAALFSFLITESANALTYEIIGACSATPAFQGSYDAEPRSAGAATIEILEKNKIPYRGSVEGIASILNTPEGKESIEIINDQEMRAYGWCFEVDGVQPDLMPDQVMLKGSEHLKWFYAFSHYKSGQWLTYCEPAYTIRPKSLCL